MDRSTHTEPFGDPIGTEAARVKLANAILSIAQAGSNDPEQIKNDALTAMALGEHKPWD